MQSGIKDLFELTNTDVLLLRTTKYLQDPTFLYLTGLDPNRFDQNLVIIPKNKPRPILVVHESERKESQGLGVEVLGVKNQKEMLQKIKPLLQNKKVGIHYEIYPYNRVLALRKNFKPKKIVDISKAIGVLRQKKTPQELQKIKTACKITLEIFEQIPQLIKKYPTETALSEKLADLARQNNCGLSYPPIVATGKNAACPHHYPTRQKIQSNNFLLIDYGVSYQGYCADISRTFFVGNPSEEDRWNYWVVWQAQQAVMKMLAPGIVASEPYKVADRIIFSATKHHIPHALGHGIGLDVHDYPTRLAIDEKWILEKNNVLAIEPALYTKKFGIRIEDDVVVTENKNRPLTKAPSELICL